MKTLGLLLLLLLLSSLALGQAYIPEEDTQVLIEVEQTDRLQALKLLRQQLDLDKNNLVLLSRVISDYIKLGKQYADERYFSYAESLLIPYIKNDMLNAQLKVHWADILQRQHQFKKALLILEQVLTEVPGQSQARLMRAVIYQVNGQYALAMQDCKALLGQVELLIAVTCIAQIDGLQGQLERGSQLLQQTLERYRDSDKETLAWSKTVLAEMKLRAGKQQEASDLLSDILNTQDSDYYALAMQADIWLQQGRYDDVMTLLRAHKKISKLLLRFVIAARYAGQEQSRDMNDLTLVIERAQRFPGGAHKRLLARYYLDVKRSPQLALATARANWQEQREPDDALLLARSLFAEKAYDELLKLRESLVKTGLYDQRIEVVFNEGLL